MYISSLLHYIDFTHKYGSRSIDTVKRKLYKKNGKYNRLIAYTLFSIYIWLL